jgi:hypothetical protein
MKVDRTNDEKKIVFVIFSFFRTMWHIEKHKKTIYSKMRIIIQGDSRVIMSLTKFMMQPTIHARHSFLVCAFINYST